MSNFEKAKNSHEELMQERYKHRDKTADEMFEELGVKSEYIYDNTVLYLYKEGYLDIYLDLEQKEMAINMDRYLKNTLQYYLAFNEKLKELGWLDE